MSNGFTFYVRIKELAFVVALAVFLSLALIFLPIQSDILFMSPTVVVPIIYSIVCFILDRDLHGFRIAYIGFDLAITFFAILLSYGLSWLGLTFLIILIG